MRRAACVAPAAGGMTYIACYRFFIHIRRLFFANRPSNYHPMFQDL